jgi:hypothetical protein
LAGVQPKCIEKSIDFGADRIALGAAVSTPSSPVTDVPQTSDPNGDNKQNGEF